MFYGEFKNSIDVKGRISVPVKFRKELGEAFMLCRGIEGKRCLCIYPEQAWAELDEKIRQLPSVKSSKVKRFLYAGATTLECDSQGRVLLPQNLREYADVEGEAFILGMSTHLEIWNTEAWKQENEDCTPESIGSIMEELNF